MGRGTHSKRGGVAMIIEPSVLTAHMQRMAEEEAQYVIGMDEMALRLATHIAARGLMAGPSLPWAKTQEIIRFNPGALSVWAGINGHGKSLLLGQVALWWMGQRQTVVLASLEMKPEETLYRMSRQMLGRNIELGEFETPIQALRDHLWIYDQNDSVAADRILALVHYAANELGADHIVIDSLTKCGLSRDDYTAQARFVDKLQWAAKRHNVHVHLVCHMRKGSDERGGSPGKFDIRGAAEVTDLADNVLVVYRNKAKELAEEKRRGMGFLSDAEKTALQDPDSFLTVEKNREHGHEARFGLWYHNGAMQFLGSDTPHAMVWEKAPPEWQGAAARAQMLAARAVA